MLRPDPSPTAEQPIPEQGRWYHPGEMIPGRATVEGTERYRRRFEGVTAEGHFRRLGAIWLSSIGLGTYLGEADDTTDAAYEEAILEALRGGCNVFDTAINYRHQRSERAVGRAIARAIEEGTVARDEIFVSTKAGFLPFDDGLPADPPAYLRATYLDSGLLDPGDIAAGCHAMTPAYLADQLARSRSNLALETVDLFHLHNPEARLGEKTRPEVERELAEAFAWLEDRTRSGEIGCYGTATWNGYRTLPQAPDHLDLESLRALSAEAPSDSFAAVQLPFNLAMPEALVRPTQTIEDATVPLFVAARHFGVAVFTSASILQGRVRQLPREIAEALPGLATDAQRALQFARSAPGVTTALVGMATLEHVRENLAVAELEPAPPQAYQQLFGGQRGPSS